MPFHNSILVNFMVYQYRHERFSLQLFAHSENSGWFSMISVIIFKVNIASEQKQALLKASFMVFVSFHCRELFCCPLCPTAALVSLHWSHSHYQWIFQTRGSIASDSLTLLFTQYNSAWLTAISGHCLAGRTGCRGANRIPTKLYAKTSPHLGYMSAFSILLVFSRLLL